MHLCFFKMYYVMNIREKHRNCEILIPMFFSQFCEKKKKRDVNPELRDMNCQKRYI